MKVGLVYTTFYDLELLSDSIQPIRHCIDYVVMVHQKVGFNGMPEPEFNSTLIEKCIQDKVVDKVIYYSGADVTTGMMDKMNVGLEELKKQGCTHIMGLAPDMTYNTGELKEILTKVKEEDIDTVYFPIKAFYYDKQHYFIDTYYFQGIHKIDNRVFERCTSTYLCDPQAKMQEGKYIMSHYAVLHYTFLRDSYANKLKNSIRSVNSPARQSDMQRIYDRLINWKEGQKALVFQNDMTRRGKVILSEVDLQVILKNIYTIVICIPIYERPEVTDFTFNYYKTIIDAYKTKINIIVVVAGSEGEKSKQLAEKYDFVYIETQNNPLAQKHNELYLKAKELNPDACIKIDSDTIVSYHFFDWYIQLLNDGYDYADVLDIYIAIKDTLCYTKGYVGKRAGEGTGVSRFMSRRLLDMVGWKLWGESIKDYGFDSIMTQRIKNLPLKRKSIRCADINGYCIDIKCNKNLTPFEHFSFDEFLPINHFNFDLTPIANLLYKKQNSNLYSVIIPTMWRCNEYLLPMLEKYKECSMVGEIILINNDYGKTPLDLPHHGKLCMIGKGCNMYVNPAWNWGVGLAKEEKLLILNDDIFIDGFFSLLEKLDQCMERGRIIGNSPMNIKQQQEFDTTKDFSIVPAPAERPRHFGIFMAMFKEDYKRIPDVFKLWVGDDIQYYSLKPYVFTGIEIKTHMSKTIKSTGLRPMAEKESELYQKHYNKDGSLKQPIINIYIHPKSIKTLKEPCYVVDSGKNKEKLQQQRIPFHIGDIDNIQELANQLGHKEWKDIQA